MCTQFSDLYIYIYIFPIEHERQDLHQEGGLKTRFPQVGGMKAGFSQVGGDSIQESP